MKKYTVLLALLAVFPAFAASDYSYSTARPVQTRTYKTATSNRRTGGYNNVISNNFYYTQPTRQTSSYAPARKSANNGYVAKNARTNRVAAPTNTKYKARKQSENSYSQERKYFLAHPFFQPLQGRFGSVTDISYAQNKFNFDLLNGTVLDIDRSSATYNQILTSGAVNVSGKQETSQFLVKEDFSFGLTDNLAVIGMLQYDKSKVSFKDWSSGEAGDSASDSGLNLFGIGLQYRFIDNDDWIAMMSGYFQHQKDTANTFIAEMKAGYKLNRTTLYGLGRFGYSSLIDGDTYGAFVDSDSGDWMMLSYKTDSKNVIYVEGGVGAFAVLNKYFTLNGELIYGYYDWHNQLNIKGAVGFQPGDMFALNLYASTALYDSGKGKTKTYLNYDVAPEGFSSNLVYTSGDYKIKDYNEWKIGLQAILYF